MDDSEYVVGLTTETADQETAEALDRSERVGDDFARGAARLTRGVVLANQPGERRAAGLELLARSGDPSERQGNPHWWFVGTETAKERARLGALEGSIALGREMTEFLFASGDAIARGPAVSVLVEIANDILQERVAPNEGAATLAAIGSRLDAVSKDLIVFSGLDSEWDDIHGRPAYRRELEHDIVVAADRFRSRYGK